MHRREVFIVESSHLVRDALETILRAGGFSVAGCATSLTEAIAAPDAAFDVLVWTAEEGEVEMLRQARIAHPIARVIVLAHRTLTEDVTDEIVATGIDAFLSKDISASVLVNAIELVMHGQRILPARCVTTVGSPLLREPESKARMYHDGTSHAAGSFRHDGVSLSGRENQILRFLIGGSSNKVIARELSISEATVKVHVKGLLRKVRAANRTQAAIWGLNHYNHGVNGAAGPAPI